MPTSIAWAIRTCAKKQGNWNLTKRMKDAKEAGEDKLEPHHESQIATLINH